MIALRRNPIEFEKFQFQVDKVYDDTFLHCLKTKDINNCLK